MRILMFGRGVIATIYGQALETAGHDVEFYVRPGRIAELGHEVQADIVDARRRLGRQRVRATVPLRLRESVHPDDGFDLIILSVAHHRLSEAAEFLAPRIGSTTVLVFGNVWDEPAAAVGPLPIEQVVLGFPQAGGGFTEDGVLHGALLRGVLIGRAGPSLSPREQAVKNAFRQAGIAVREETDMRGWLYIHFASDAGMFAHGTQGGALAGMIGDRRAITSALKTGRELLPVLSARGVDLQRHSTALMPLNRPGPVAAVMALATALVPIAQVSLAAHTDPYSAEAQAIIRDALAAAQRFGVAVPLLEAAGRRLP